MAYFQEGEFEGQYYSKLAETHLQDALDALWELEYIARTSDKNFFLQHKMRKYKQINESCQFSEGSKYLAPQRTFFSGNYTTVNDFTFFLSRLYHKIIIIFLISGEKNSYLDQDFNPGFYELAYYYPLDMQQREFLSSLVSFLFAG